MQPTAELELRFLILFEDQQTSTQTRRLFLPAKTSKTQ